MLKIGFIKNVFYASKYICVRNINKPFITQISTTHKYFKKWQDQDDSMKFPEDSAGTMLDVKKEIMRRIGVQPGYSEIPQSRAHLTKHEPKFEDLPERTMQDSFTSAIIPLSTDLKLQIKYVNVAGEIRIGALMEDMDLFAVWVCHKHVHIPNLDSNIPLPYTFVTVLVDKIDFTDDFRPFDKDIRISGHVSWIGRSSMEIVVWLEQMGENGVRHKITRALFLMAARNATNTKSAVVNPLKLNNDYEKEIFAGGLERKNRRIKTSNISLLKVVPNNIEQNIIHDLFMRSTPKNSIELNKRVLPMDCRWMKNHVISNVIVSFPKNRNSHNRIFGGHIMKIAFQVSWLCAYKYCGTRPKIKHICDISFRKPVDVSSFIKMTAQVVYTEKNYVQIMTIADILNFENNDDGDTSNVFYYTFSICNKVPEILPTSYHEAMWYLEGRRKFAYSLNLNEEC